MHTDLSNADYHNHPATSKSRLDLARKSGRHLFDALYGPPRDSTAAFDFGTVFHATALPGECVDSIAVRMPEGMKKTTKEGKAFVASFSASRAEMRKVVWPTGKETNQSTLIVLVVVVIMGIFLYFADWVLGWLISSIIG